MQLLRAQITKGKKDTWVDYLFALLGTSRKKSCSSNVDEIETWRSVSFVKLFDQIYRSSRSKLCPERSFQMENLACFSPACRSCSTRFSGTWRWTLFRSRPRCRPSKCSCKARPRSVQWKLHLRRCTPNNQGYQYLTLKLL